MDELHGGYGGLRGEIDAVTASALRARHGDHGAATAFVRATQADVWRVCAHLGSGRDADDLTQETYARAFASLHRFGGRSSARTWLLAIARRVCADAVRAAVRARKLDLAETDAAGSGGPHATDPAESVALNAMLDALDPQRREAFVLTQLVGLSYAEAADVCGCPVGTIRSRVARARADLVAGFGDGRSRAAGS
jgi:RNA polymerase sigma-70 factor (ECF subfamily)